MGFRTALLAWPDGKQRLCREGDANMGAGNTGKGGACWRGPTKEYGFAGRATPTWVPVISHRRRDGFFAPLERKGRSDRIELRLLRLCFLIIL